MSQVTHHSGEAEHRHKSRFSRSLMETHMMAYNNKDDPRKVRADDNEIAIHSASTLLPMLVGRSCSNYHCSNRGHDDRLRALCQTPSTEWINQTLGTHTGPWCGRGRSGRGLWLAFDEIEVPRGALKSAGVCRLGRAGIGDLVHHARRHQVNGLLAAAHSPHGAALGESTSISPSITKEMSQLMLCRCAGMRPPGSRI